jgi:hypothetical protein
MLVKVSESSANTCPPPKVVAYSASATDAATTGMRWQKASMGSIVGDGGRGSMRGWDYKRRDGQGTVFLFGFVCDFLGVGG